MPGVTSADVARESGVSRTTVSYVLNDTVGVAISQATRERVREAAQRLGYSPSAAARALRTGRSDIVLCVLPDWPIGPVIDTLLDALAHELAERGLSMLVHHGHVPRPLAELWRAVTPRAVVGFAPFTAEEQASMRRAGIQVLGTDLDGGTAGSGGSPRDAPGASPDGPADPERPGPFSVSQVRVGHLQAEFLTGRGRERLGYAAPTDSRVAEFARRRLAGVRAHCQALDLPAPVVVEVDLEVASARAAARTWRSGAAPVTGVAAYNDDVALAVLAGLRAEGLDVPGDVAVIGVDDVPAARLSAPALSTVAQSVPLQAQHLGAYVLAALDGTTSPPPPAELLSVVVRDST